MWPLIGREPERNRTGSSHWLGHDPKHNQSTLADVELSAVLDDLTYFTRLFMLYHMLNILIAPTVSRQSVLPDLQFRNCDSMTNTARFSSQPRMPVGSILPVIPNHPDWFFKLSFNMAQHIYPYHLQSIPALFQQIKLQKESIRLSFQLHCIHVTIRTGVLSVLYTIPYPFRAMSSPSWVGLTIFRCSGLISAMKSEALAYCSFPQTSKLVDKVK